MKYKKYVYIKCISERKQKMTNLNDITFDKGCDLYLAFKENNIKKSTYYNYKYTIEKYFRKDLGNKTLSDLLEFDFNSYIKSKKDNLEIAIIIGPEGGLDKEEVDILKENGAKIITLGKRILRTETVALALTAIIMYELGDLS